MYLNDLISAKFTRRRAVVCGLLTAAAVAVPTALAIGSSSGPDLNQRLAAGPASPVQSVSPSLAKVVPALRGPIDTSPPAVVEAIASNTDAAALGVNPR